jgi:hypothetical protein
MIGNRLTYLALCLLTACPAALAQNGVSEFEFEQNGNTGYVDCIGESMDYSLNVIRRIHVFETSSGNLHVVDNWFYDGTAIGSISGNAWSTHGPWPFRINAGGSRVARGEKLTIMYDPLDGQSRLKVDLLAQVTVDANGMARVDMESFSFRCVGG